VSPDDLPGLLRARPFHPFRIHLLKGTVYEVSHPEMERVERTQAEVFFPDTNLPFPAAERHEHVALLHISLIEPQQEAAA